MQLLRLVQSGKILDGYIGDLPEYLMISCLPEVKILPGVGILTKILTIRGVERQIDTVL
jgi:hypothetical protein